jgi:hypothetical protein
MPEGWGTVSDVILCGFTDIRCPVSLQCLKLSANQPTKKLTKGGILCKRKVSSIANLTHSCARNAYLGLEKRAWSAVTGGMLMLTGLLLWLKAVLDMFRLGTVSTGGNMNPWGNLSFTIRTLAGWISGRWTRGRASLWLKASATWGGVILFEGLHACRGRAMLLFLIIPRHLPRNWGKVRKPSVRIAGWC